MSVKYIFTFWEPRTSLPAYLKLCMQTWKKFLPEYEIIILDYSSLDKWLGKDFFDKCLYKSFSLPKQADAIRCAILKKYGGIWMDCDTIITSEKVKRFLTLKSSFVLIGHHIAFIVADSNSIVLRKWLEKVRIYLKFYKNYYSNLKRIRFLLWLQNPIKYNKTVRKLEKFSFLGNTPLSKILKKLKNKPQDFISVNRETIGAFPELLKYGTVSLDTYQRFYFENDFSEQVLKNNQGIILLHNSWTPERFLNMTEKEFLSQNNTMANLLKKLKDK